VPTGRVMPLARASSASPCTCALVAVLLVRRRFEGPERAARAGSGVNDLVPPTRALMAGGRPFALTSEPAWLNRCQS
jgi:hypothetical protein